MTPVLFTLKELTETLKMDDPEWIRTLMRFGVITPVVRGGKGRGNVNKFSGQQALGIAAVAGLCHSPRGCKLGYGKKVMDWFDAMPESVLIDWATRPDDKPDSDAYTEEDLAAWDASPQAKAIRPHPCPVCGKAALDAENAQPWDEEEKREFNKNFQEVWDWVLAAVRRKLAQNGYGRITEQGKKAEATKSGK